MPGRLPNCTQVQSAIGYHRLTAEWQVVERTTSMLRTPVAPLSLVRPAALNMAVLALQVCVFVCVHRAQVGGVCGIVSGWEFGAAAAVEAGAGEAAGGISLDSSSSQQWGFLPCWAAGILCSPDDVRA